MKEVTNPPSNVSNPPVIRPWTDSRGRKLRDSSLKIRSRSWSPATWEEYLSSLDSPETESLLPNFDRLLHQYGVQNAVDPSESYFESEVNNNSTEIRQAMRKLTRKERRVIRLLYWNGLTDGEIATKLKLAKTTVQATRRRALKKMEKELVSGGVVFGKVVP